MIHKTERMAKIVWLLADAIASTWSDPLLDELRLAVARTRRHVTFKLDKSMIRTIDGVHDFIKDVLGDGETDRETQAAYFHMLNALASDKWISVHRKSGTQKAAWLALTNAVVGFIKNFDPDGELGMAKGCMFADRMEEIINSI